MSTVRYDTYNVYLEDIKSKDCKLLSLEEEIELGKRIKEKDTKAVQKLVEHNLRLAINIANNYRDNGVEFAELIEIGNEALVRAAWNFDYTKNVRFSTYATECIDKTISSKMHLYKVSTYINRYLNQKLKNFYKVYNSFDEHDQDRFNKTIEILNMTVEEASEMLKLSGGVLSLNNKIDEETEEEMINFLQDDSNFEDELINSLFVKEIFNCNYLNEREKKILKLRFGIGYEREFYLEEVGKILGLQKSNVLRIEQAALRKIRVRNKDKEYLKK